MAAKIYKVHKKLKRSTNGSLWSPVLYTTNPDTAESRKNELENEGFTAEVVEIPTKGA